MDLLDDWECFLQNKPLAVLTEALVGDVPAPSPLYISTKTFIGFLDRKIPLAEAFWNIPVLAYNDRRCGVIKKQMKFSSDTAEEVADIEARTKAADYSVTHIMAHNPAGRFKDVRKVTVGISKKDIVTFRVKPKGAFYNCFVVIVRIATGDVFREFHVKVFNTGKIEVPGIQDNAHLRPVVDILLANLNFPAVFVPGSEEIVLVNSNFNCNYYINREELYSKLRYKVGMSVMYDPCSYPGIQCKLFYNEANEIVLSNPKKNLPSMSIMIFRTGSVLIVGKCQESILPAIYTYLLRVFGEEYGHIVDKNCAHLKKEIKPRKFRKCILIQ